VIPKGNNDIASVLGTEARESPTAHEGLESLTPRQLEVLRLVARGLSYAEIAQALFVSRRTVHAHVRMIFRKLEVGNRSLATRYAVQHGLT
jgi:DNA-binding NarL/FixJ family response regulator